jgi:hypothetical protein
MAKAKIPLSANEGLIFSFSAMMQEIDSLSKIAKSYIWKDSINVLSNLGTDLENRRGHDMSTRPWGISESMPLRTIPGQKYDRNCRETVFGEVSSIWEIRPIRLRDWKKSKQAEQFELIGNASTRARIIKGTPDQPGDELAMWRMEIGNFDSPGCHFHVQILGRDDDIVFPKSLPVPRLPGLLITPMEVFEYLLGELFQHEWAQESARENDSMRYWATHQKKRFTTLFKTQLEQINKSHGSPWANLKKWKPESNLFVD